MLKYQFIHSTRHPDYANIQSLYRHSFPPQRAERSRQIDRRRPFCQSRFLSRRSAMGRLRLLAHRPIHRSHHLFLRRAKIKRQRLRLENPANDSNRPSRPGDFSRHRNDSRTHRQPGAARPKKSVLPSQRLPGNKHPIHVAKRVV